MADVHSLKILFKIKILDIWSAPCKRAIICRHRLSGGRFALIVQYDEWFYVRNYRQRVNFADEEPKSAKTRYGISAVGENIWSAAMPGGSAGPDDAEDGPVGGRQPAGDQNEKVLKGRLRHFAGEDLQQGEKSRSNIHGSHPSSLKTLDTSKEYGSGSRLFTPNRQTTRTEKCESRT